MAYNNITSRTDAAALIPEDVSNDILDRVVEQSAALTFFRRGRRMTRNQTRMPVLASLPVAYFVNGDTGLKQTTEIGWANKYLNAEEIAVIMPVPEAVVDDMDADIWGEAVPLLTEAIGRALDAAVFFGTNKPASWPDAIVTLATGAGNTVTRGTAAAAAGGIAEDINDLMATIEADGFDVNGFIAPRTFRSRLRGARDTSGQKLLDVTNETVEGIRVQYAMSGLWPTGAGAAELFGGDWTQAIIALRQDITIKMLDQAVIQDNTGAIVYNLAQQDMVAMRLTFRAAYQVANVVNYAQANDAARSPFGVLLAP